MNAMDEFDALVHPHQKFAAAGSADATLSGADTLRFILAGQAIFTVRNEETGKRYTYRVAQAKEANTRGERPYFVGILNGSDNNSDYAYTGCIFPNEPTVVRTTVKSHRSFAGGPAHLGLEWLLRRLYSGTALPAKVKVYHEGRCGRCGRRLTTPESVKRGIGPECAGLMGLE